MITLLDLCVSSLRRGHANLLCIVPILTDDPRRESKRKAQQKSKPLPKVKTISLPSRGGLQGGPYRLHRRLNTRAWLPRAQRPPETPNGSQRSPEAPEGSHRLPEAPRRLPELHRGSQKFPKAPKDSQKLPGARRGSQRLPEDPKSFQRLPEAPYRGTIIPRRDPPVRSPGVLQVSSMGHSKVFSSSPPPPPGGGGEGGGGGGESEGFFLRGGGEWGSPGRREGFF